MRIHAGTVLAFLLSIAGGAQAAAEPTLTRETAREMVRQTIHWVEKDGLPPRSRQQYDERKRSVQQLVDTTDEAIDRDQLYERLRALLGTLGTGGHTFLVDSKRPQAGFGIKLLKSSSAPGLVRLIDTPAGSVLHLTPPQFIGLDKQRMHDYAAGGLRYMESSTLPARACALLIDLTEQKGGNAWPPMDLLQPLFTAANSASFVDRDGRRAPLISLPQLAARRAGLGADIANPLQRFAGQPLAFVMNGDTSSAGEMLAVALLGEGERVRSFGWPSGGMTTVNQTYELADDAMLVLTVSHYGLGNAPVIQGKLQPQVAAQDGDGMADVLMTAATWVAGQSSLCRRGHSANE